MRWENCGEALGGLHACAQMAERYARLPEKHRSRAAGGSLQIRTLYGLMITVVLRRQGSDFPILILKALQ